MHRIRLCVGTVTIGQAALGLQAATTGQSRRPASGKGVPVEFGRMARSGCMLPIAEVPKHNVDSSKLTKATRGRWAVGFPRPI